MSESYVRYRRIYRSWVVVVNMSSTTEQREMLLYKSSALKVFFYRKKKKNVNKIQYIIFQVIWLHVIKNTNFI